MKNNTQLILALAASLICYSTYIVLIDKPFSLQALNLFLFPVILYFVFIRSRNVEQSPLKAVRVEGHYHIIKLMVKQLSLFSIKMRLNL